MPTNLSDIFDRVVVINLARRHDRMERFEQRLVDWPFARPVRFKAVDGLAVEVPAAWDKGPGAYGCFRSHQSVVESAVADGVRALLVLEDDACPVARFGQQAEALFNALPDDWDGLMLGAEHLFPPQPIRPGVVRCTIANRMHAYALRPKAIKEYAVLLRHMRNDHCDVVLASMMKRHHFYAPDPLLIGQDEGLSDISGIHEQTRFLSAHQRIIEAGKNRRRLLDQLVTRLDTGDSFKIALARRGR